MAYGAWDHRTGNKDVKFQEAPDAKVAEYLKHVKNGTVPPESKIPYSFRAPKPFVFISGAKPVYPAWTMTTAEIAASWLRQGESVIVSCGTSDFILTPPMLPCVREGNEGELVVHSVSYWNCRIYLA